MMRESGFNPFAVPRQADPGLDAEEPVAAGAEFRRVRSEWTIPRPAVSS
jgi:hypothetical protein